MQKFSVNLVQLEEAITSGDFKSIDVAIESLTNESVFDFVSVAIKTIVHKFTKTISGLEKDLVYPKGFIKSTKRLMKSMDSTKFMDVINTGFFIERGFKGNKQQYMRDCLNISTTSLYDFYDLHATLVSTLKEINRLEGAVSSLPTEAMEKGMIGHGYNSVTTYFTGNAEVAKVGECFNNNQDLIRYLGDSISIKPSRMSEDMKTVRDKMEEIMQLLDDVSPALEAADAHTMKFIIKYVEVLSSKTRDLGAANAAIITNVGTASNLVAALQTFK